MQRFRAAQTWKIVQLLFADVEEERDHGQTNGIGKSIDDLYSDYNSSSEFDMLKLDHR